MRKFALLAALAAVVVAAFASTASASVTPASTTVTGTSTNAKLVIGGWSITCNSGVMFTTLGVMQWHNAFQPLTSDTGGNVRFGPSCSPSATVTTQSGWQIKADESPAASDLSDLDETTTSTVTATATAGTTISLGFPAGCIITVGAGTATGTYTDGSTSLTVATPNNLSYTANSNCAILGIGSSGSTAGFSATYTTDMGIIVT